LGREVSGNVVVFDILAVPNVSTTPTHKYLDYDESKYFLPLMLKATGFSHVGSFHSHPDGSIPSENDMTTCPGLHLWVIHHGAGHHTFVAAMNYRHLEVELLNETNFVHHPGFRGEKFFLGDIEVNGLGKVVGDGFSIFLLNAPEKTRLSLVTALRLQKDGERVEIKKIAEALGVSNRTVRKWLNPAKKFVELKRGYIKLKL